MSSPCLALVAHDALGAPPRAATAWTLDRTRFHQGDAGALLMTLPRCQQEREQTTSLAREFGISRETLYQYLRTSIQTAVSTAN